VSRERSKEIKGAGFNVFTSGGRFWTLVFYQQWDPKQPAADRRVREALNLAIDRKAILENILSGMGELTSFSPGGKTTIGYEPMEPYPYDPARAKKLLAEAGYPNGWQWDFIVSIQSGAPENVQVAEVVAAYWEKLGVKSKIQVLDWPTTRSRWNKKELVNCAHLLAASYRPTVSQYVNYVGSRASLITVLDPEIDQWLRIAEGDFDPKKRHEAAHKVQVKMYNEYQWGPLFDTGDVLATLPEIKSWNMGKIGFDINLEDIFTRK